MAGQKSTYEAIEELFADMQKTTEIQMKAEEALNKLRISNAQKLAQMQLDLINKKAKEELDFQQEFFEKYLEKGGNIEAIIAREAHRNKLKNLDEELRKNLEGKTEAEKEISLKAAELEREALETLYNEKLNREIGLREEIQKLDEAEEKAKEMKAAKKALADKKKLQQDAQTLGTTALSTLTNGAKNVTQTFTQMFKKENVEALKMELAAEGITGDDAKKVINRTRSVAAVNALASLAKQLESTAKETAEAQSAIDTRLQGSKNGKSWLSGSYWKEMSTNISKNIGFSPFLKQADAVNNLKTLVGKGIAYNVEQRAFLDTISSKIATTFEATEGTLLKLVRIQQADTTASRLGMESALTAFLNSMYETSEYMTEAADAIRGSIYEASALMTAEEATEFEYQVQKWMGSLYSVGFQNTQGLADALGKLAAGDIEGVTSDGYGNLLVMAANKANLSIAEMLQEGLNDDTTNALMQAMVDYLGGIYKETKDNKVVSQQFANVYGLTASDLKAAANLASSTQTIYETNLNYGGMMQQLTNMANSMASRTDIGTMVNNVIENFKYSTATEMGNNPVLYTLYTAATLLDETVGGIDLPSISALAMGSGPIIDLRTSVADLMRVGAVGGSMLGGIGKMIAGLAGGGGFTGKRMLESFGVNLNGSAADTLVRGNTAGLVVTESGMDTSLSGFVGNEDGEAVKNKVITDAQDDANKKAVEALEAAEELSQVEVDSAIMGIYELLDAVVLGSKKFHVILANELSGGWSTGEDSPAGVPGVSNNAAFGF